MNPPTGYKKSMLNSFNAKGYFGNHSGTAKRRFCLFNSQTSVKEFIHIDRLG